jgi:hypothetical protein
LERFCNWITIEWPFFATPEGKPYAVKMASNSIQMAKMALKYAGENFTPDNLHWPDPTPSIVTFTGPPNSISHTDKDVQCIGSLTLPKEE